MGTRIGSPGGRGGAGQWTVENTFSYEPPDTVAGTIGGQATSRSVGGYGNGGTSNTVLREQVVEVEVVPP